MMQQLNSYVYSINRESNDFVMMLHQNSEGVPFDVSIRFTRSLYDAHLFDDGNWESLKENVEERSDKTMFVRSTPWEYGNGIIEIAISPKTHGFSQEKAVKTLTWITKFFREIQNGGPLV